MHFWCFRCSVLWTDEGGVLLPCALICHLQVFARNLRLREGGLMAAWQLEPKPSAELTPVDPAPLDRGDGATVQRWQTARGVIHAQVIYPTHRIEWYLQVRP